MNIININTSLVFNDHTDKKHLPEVLFGYQIKNISKEPLRVLHLRFQ